MTREFKKRATQQTLRFGMENYLAVFALDAERTKELRPITKITINR